MILEVLPRALAPELINRNRAGLNMWFEVEPAFCPILINRFSSYCISTSEVNGYLENIEIEIHQYVRQWQ